MCATLNRSRPLKWLPNEASPNLIWSKAALGSVDARENEEREREFTSMSNRFSLPAR